MTANQRLIFANDSFLDEFGYTISELRGKHPKDIIARFEMAAPPYEEIESALLKEGKWKGEVAFRKKDGSMVYMEVFVPDNSERSGGYFCTCLCLW